MGKWKAGQRIPVALFTSLHANRPNVTAVTSIPSAWLSKMVYEATQCLFLPIVLQDRTFFFNKKMLKLSFFVRSTSNPGFVAFQRYPKISKQINNLRSLCKKNFCHLLLHHKWLCHNTSQGWHIVTPRRNHWLCL